MVKRLRRGKPPFKEVGPTHVFEAAADAGQSVGARRSRVFGSRPGINPCRTVQAVTATPGTPKSDIVPKRETDFTKNVRHIWRSRGTLARTDRIKPELIARFMAFRPEAGLRLPNGKLRVLRALAAKRKQFVEMRKRHALHCKADEKNGTACECEDIDADLREVLDRRIKDLEQRIKACLDSDGALAETVAVLRSVPGIGLVACAMPVAEMPELGRISGEQAAALAGLAPVARDSGQMCGKRMIGGRRALRCVLYQAALFASIHNTDLKVFADQLWKEGKPHKVVVTAVDRKLVVIANALCKSRELWAAKTG